MDQSCIDWDPGDTFGSAGPYRILHLTKITPSPGGPARTAPDLDRALSHLGPTTVLGLVGHSRSSQELRSVLRVLWRLLHHLRRERHELVVVTLSGRALAELFAATLLSLVPRRRRPAFWLVAHDPPELAGPPLMFACFDRPGGRRAGMWLSRVVGAPLERRVTRTADAVVAFSDLGRDAIAARFPAARAWSAPLPTHRPPAEAREPVVYCPAGVTARDLEPSLQAFAGGRLPGDYRLRIGSMTAPAESTVRDRCRTLGVSGRVELTGHLDDEALDHSFATARIVVRHLSAPPTTGSWAPASGPVISALSAGCALVSNDPRGSRRCIEIAGIISSPSGDDIRTHLERLTNSPLLVGELSERALAHVAACHEPAAVSRYLRAIWRSHAHADGESTRR